MIFFLGLRLLLDVPPEVIPREMSTSHNFLHSREWASRTDSVSLDLGPIMEHRSVNNKKYIYFFSKQGSKVCNLRHVKGIYNISTANGVI